MKKSFKRAAAAVLALTVMCGSAPVMPGSQSFLKTSFVADAAGGTTEQGLRYEVHSGEIYIVGYNDNLYGKVEIPAKINGTPVTSIEESAFHRCTNLEELTIPDSMKSIGDSAFYYCDNLRKISIPYNSVTTIGKNAFANCHNLISISIPRTVAMIDESTFYNCTALESVSLPLSVTTIRRNAFYRCSSLNDIKIPASVTVIKDSAFSYCENLTEIYIPFSVTDIGDRVFYGCNDLTSVTLADGVSSIGTEAFSRCCNLNSIEIPDSVTSIDESAFEGCDDLTIAANSGSYAETYAKENGISFNLLDEPPSSVTELKKGDANLDGNVNIADAVLVMQVATNPDKYAQGKSEFSITAQGEKNADVDGKKGLSNSDALLIQKFKLGLITSFD